jgi:beta-glucosidase
VRRDVPRTGTGWEVFPQGLADVLAWLRDDYGNPPVFVTENGAAFPDPPPHAGGVAADLRRMDYLRRHLRVLHGAIAQGCDVRGYMAWSLLDNFEWSLGFSQRFGLVHVDFATQARTPRPSARLYARIAASHGSALAEDA